MINKLPSSIINHAASNATLKAGNTLTTRFMKSKAVGKVCEMAAKNPVAVQSLFSLGICCIARPATNMITTSDKKDASFASCHSISSGLIGWVWPMFFSTPIAMAVGIMLKKPQKFFNANLMKKLYPSVGIETITKNGKKIERAMVNAKNQLLKQDGSLLSRNLEPLKVTKNKIEEFLKLNPKLTVDKHGIARSTEAFQTKDGKYVLDKEGNKIGCALQKADKTPITEEVELGIKKEQNMASFVSWVPDILLAPPRAMLTIALIPYLLNNVFGIQKGAKGGKPAEPTPAGANTKVATPQTANAQVAATKTAQAPNNYKQNNQSPAFKGNKKPSTFVSLAGRSIVAAKQIDKAHNWLIEDLLAKKILAPILNSKFAGKLIDKSVKVDDMTSHMTTAGSIVTTGVYATSTLHNKGLNKTKEDKKASKTLALNQWLVTILSTIGAYTINKSVDNYTKKMSYKFRDANQSHPMLEKRVQGFKIAQKLLTFSLMYRYIAPVLVTPIASKIGKSINNNSPVAAKAKTPATVATTKAPIQVAKASAPAVKTPVATTVKA